MGPLINQHLAKVIRHAVRTVLGRQGIEERIPGEGRESSDENPSPQRREWRKCLPWEAECPGIYGVADAGKSQRQKYAAINQLGSAQREHDLAHASRAGNQREQASLPGIQQRHGVAQQQHAERPRRSQREQSAEKNRHHSDHAGENPIMLEKSIMASVPSARESHRTELYRAARRTAYPPT